MKNIAVLGYGTVGSGVVEVFYKNRESIQRKTGCEMDIKYILEVRDFPDSPYRDKMTSDYNRILEDDSVAVVVEVMGGTDPAFRFVTDALKHKKSVVTSNKELVAVKGAEILRIAKENDVNFLFEASVGGGIPIIHPLHQCLAANEIDAIEGILNGTTNYILTKMIKEGASFDATLKKAQELGYAEKDPTADVEGIDACRKICILASLAFGNHVYPQDVYCEGITKISAQDVSYAEDFGSVIKLIGRAKKLPNGKVQALVSPCFVPTESQLSTVDDVFNGILVRGDATGDVMFYGKGAGKLPTASAVIADVIDCVKATGTIQSIQWADSKGDVVEKRENTSTRMFIRGLVTSSWQIGHVKELFGHVKKLARKGQDDNEVAFVTELMTEGELDKKIAQLEKDGMKVFSTIRVLECGE